MSLKTRVKRLEAEQTQAAHGLHTTVECDPDCPPDCHHRAGVCRDPNCRVPVLVLDVELQE